MLMALRLVGAQWQPPFFLSESAFKPASPLAANGVPGTSEGFINAQRTCWRTCWVTPFIMALSIGLRRRQANQAVVIRVHCRLSICSPPLLEPMSQRRPAGLWNKHRLDSWLFVNGRWRLVLASGAHSLLILFSHGRSGRGRHRGRQLGLSGRIEIWSRPFWYRSSAYGVNGFRRVVHVLPLFGIADESTSPMPTIISCNGLRTPGLLDIGPLDNQIRDLLIVTSRNLIRRRATSPFTTH